MSQQQTPFQPVCVSLRQKENKIGFDIKEPSAKYGRGKRQKAK